jgi:hypothetical protein
MVPHLSALPEDNLPGSSHMHAHGTRAAVKRGLSASHWMNNQSLRPSSI